MSLVKSLLDIRRYLQNKKCGMDSTKPDSKRGRVDEFDGLRGILAM